MKKKGITVFCVTLMLFTTACNLTFQQSKESSEEPIAKEQLVLTTVSTGTLLSRFTHAVKEFNSDEENPVQIVLKNYGTEEYKNQLSLSMAVDEPPDMFFTWEEGFLQTYVESGKVMAITDQVKETNSTADIDPRIFESVSFQGDIYALPLVRTAAVVFYNRQLFEENNLEPPESYEQFLDTCSFFKDMGIIPLEISGSIEWSYGQLFLQYLIKVGGEDLYNGLSNGTISWTDQQVLQAAEEMKLLGENQFLNEDMLEMGMGSALKQVSDGKSAMCLEGSWCAAISEKATDTLGAFLFPVSEKSESNIGISSVDQCYAISSACSYPDAAWEFLSLLCSDEFQKGLQQYGYLPIRPQMSDTPTTQLETDMIAIDEKMEVQLNWLDRKLGAEMGTAINQTAQQILFSGETEDLLQSLQKKVDQLFVNSSDL